MCLVVEKFGSILDLVGLVEKPGLLFLVAPQICCGDAALERSGFGLPKCHVMSGL